MANRQTISALRDAINTVFRANNNRDITGPKGGSVIHDVVDTLAALAIPAQLPTIQLTDNSNNDIELHQNTAGSPECVRLLYRIKSTNDIITGMVELVRHSNTFAIAEPLGRTLYGATADVLSGAITMEPLYTDGGAGTLSLRVILAGAGSTSAIDIYNIQKLTV